MNIAFFCPLWGFEHLPFEDFCTRVRKAGYDGVELALPLHEDRKTTHIVDTLKEFGLKLIGQHWETTDPDIDNHIGRYRKRIEWQAAANPLFVNSQTGLDWFPFEANQRIIDAARAVSEKTGVRIVHETHRGKLTFCAAQTRRFLEANPEMRLAADFSHWCNVSESLLADQHESVSSAIARADHIHARVGHPEGPQISDPRAPEWQEALHAHLAWWDSIVETRRGDGTGLLTITAEFGPPTYMPTLPYTRQPVSDQWEINVHMMNLLKARYAQP